MKKFLLYGHGGAYNHGAEAILKTTIAGIRSLKNESYILLSSHFPEQDQEFGIMPDCFLERDRYYADKEKQESMQGLAVGRYDKEIYRTTIEAMDSDTIALSVGGDNYCYPAWHRWCCIHESAVKHGAKDILWSCSINPESINSKMCEALKSHYLITARESLTYLALKEKGMDNVVLCADVAFLLCPEELELPWNFLKNQTVAINISPLVMRRETRDGIVKAAVLKLMSYILEKTEMNIALVPHVVMPMDNDYVALSELFEYYKDSVYRDRICLCSDNLSAAKYKYIISQCRFGVFARTHAAIASYSTGVPALVLGYSVKARGIARDMGVEEYVLDISNLINSEQLYGKFEVLLQDEEKIKRILCDNKVKMKNLVKGMFEYLGKI